MNLPTLDPELHHATRIAIMGRLVLDGAMRFSTLRESTGLTAGNLASHVGGLQRAGYVVVEDARFTIRPGRVVAATPAGRTAVENYRAALLQVAAALREPAKARS